MPKSITTKRGDQGQTDLLGARVEKDHILVELVGSIDELNALVGLVLVEVRDRKHRGMLQRLQEQLFVLGAEVAGVTAPNRDALPHITEQDLRVIERACRDLEAHLPRLTTFILPGGSPGGARLHHVRTVARRVERRLVMAARLHPELARVLPYVNRISDLLFHLARSVNQLDGAAETPWKGTKS